MHQRRRIRTAPVTRLVTAMLVAVMLSGVLSLRPMGWSPACPLYEPWSFMWIWLQCWEAPPPSPEG